MAEISGKLRDSMANAPFPRLLGFRLLELAEGYARTAVILRPDHANFLGGVDGGLIAALGDYACACACSTLGKAVGLQGDIHWLAAPSLTGELFAEARTVHAGRTISLTEVTVTDSSGKLIAKYSGTAFARPS